MSERRRLPPRRPGIVRLVEQRDPEGSVIAVHATYGIDPRTLRVAEVFVAVKGKVNSMLDRILQDTAVTLSRLWQRGETPAETYAGLGRFGGYPAVGPPLPDLPKSGPPASIIGAIVAAAVEVQAEWDALDLSVRDALLAAHRHENRS